MLKLLKNIKKGAYAQVIQFDKDKNLCMTQLHYNSIRKKFYLSRDKRGLIRRSISKAEAEELILKTLYLKKDYAKQNQRIKEGAEISAQ